jgi:5-formyltetrahydrofolate cyclo-ligase
VIPLEKTKRLARAAALHARRTAADASPGAARQAAAHALEAIAGLRGVGTVAGYLPVRGELDPRPAMLALAGLGFGVCVPVVEAPGRPLAFRRWAPGMPTVRGLFGIEVPAVAEPGHPDVLLVPMLAFDRRGHRLGYGGGFYDRTIAALRAAGAVQAFGFAYAAQEIPAVPDAETDMRLDAIVTERGVMIPG